MSANTDISVIGQYWLLTTSVAGDLTSLEFFSVLPEPLK